MVLRRWVSIFCGVALVFSASFGGPGSTRAEIPGVSPPGSDTERLDLIYQMSRVIPAFVDSAYENEFSPFGVFDFQQKFLDSSQEAGQLDALKKRPPLQDFVITVPGKLSQHYEYRLNERGVASTRDELESALRRLPDSNLSLGERIEREMETVLRQMNGGTEERLFSILKRELSVEALRKVQSERDPVQRANLLRQLLPSRLNGNSRFSRYGLDQYPNADRIAEKFAELSEKTTRLKHLSALWFSASRIRAEDEGTMKRWLEAADSDVLSFLSEKSVVEEFSRKLATKMKSRGVFYPESEMANSLVAQARDRSSRKSIDGNLGKAQLRLREAPPLFGNLRGCAGQDCSTRLLALFSNDPNERIFYVFDGENRLKGYLSGTLVESGGKKAFRVQVINGPRISGEDAQTLLYGLNQVKAHLGAERILIPQREQLRSLINYSDIIRRMTALVGDSAPVEVDYLGRSLRERIESFSVLQSVEFYQMSKNSKAIELQGDPLREGRIKVRVEKPSLIQMAGTQSASRDFAVEIIMKAELYQRPEEAKRIALAAGLSEAELAKLLSAFNNSSFLSTSEHEISLRSALKDLGVDGEGILKSNPKLVQFGNFRAVDAMGEVHSNRNLRAALSWLKDGPLPSIFFLSHGKDVLALPEATDVLNELAAGDWRQLKRLSVLSFLELPLPESVYATLARRTYLLTYDETGPARSVLASAPDSMMGAIQAALRQSYARADGFNERLAALKAMREFGIRAGEEALSLASQGLQSSDPSLRIKSVEALNDIDDIPDERIYSVLRKIVESQDPELRSVARVVAVTRRPDHPEALRFAVEGLLDPSETERAAARQFVRFLASRKETRLKTYQAIAEDPRLMAALQEEKDPDTRVRLRQLFQASCVLERLERFQAR